MHTLVYLDQSYLSNMAKATHGLMKDSKQLGFWQSLFDDLKEGVLADRIACPELEFHRVEAKYDARIEKLIIKVVGELSWGLKFRPWDSILESQIEDAAKIFLGKRPEEKESWGIAFESDPQAPAEGRMQHMRPTDLQVDVHFSLPDQLVAEDRQRKQDFVNVTWEELERYSSNPLPWQQLLLESKKSLLDGYWGRRARESIAKRLQEGPLLSRLSAVNELSKLEDLWNRLRDIGIDANDPNVAKSFAESDELFNIPFVDINASIWAAVGESFIQGRKPQRGDFYDAPILATVLPYCDVITTDRFMKAILVEKLHFDDKYKCKVFSPTQQDRLSFQELVRGLLKQPQ